MEGGIEGSISVVLLQTMTEAIAWRSRLRGKLGTPINIVGPNMLIPFGWKSKRDTLSSVTRYVLTVHNDDESLVGFHVWQLITFRLSDGIAQDPSTLCIPLSEAGLYTINLMVYTSDEDKRIFGIQLGDDPTSPAEHGVLNSCSTLSMKATSINYTTLITAPTLLRVWTYGTVPTHITNTGDINNPIMEIVYQG